MPAWCPNLFPPSPPAPLPLAGEDDNGTYHPLTIPGISQGAFEVPMEGLMVNDTMYIYHTTGHSSQNTMGRSVVAKSVNGGRTFTYLYKFSSRYFRNISIVKVPASDWSRQVVGTENEETGLVIFGSGIYRKSHVFLAYQPASGIEDSESIRYLTEVMQKALRYGTSAPGLLAGVIPPKECLWLDRRKGDFPGRSGGISSAS